MRKPGKRNDAFEILGIEPTNDIALVKKAYHRRALELHSDKNTDKAVAKVAFQQLGRAYEKIDTQEKLIK